MSQTHIRYSLDKTTSNGIILVSNLKKYAYRDESKIQLTLHKSLHRKNLTDHLWLDYTQKHCLILRLAKLKGLVRLYEKAFAPGSLFSRKLSLQ